MSSNFARTRAHCLALLLAVAGCYADPVDSALPENLVVRLAVSGGLAGVSYAFVIDGAQGAVRGEDCTRFCDFEPGDILMPVSKAQIENLARDLEAAAIFSLDGVDFGTACCDDFYYELDVSDGIRSASVRGTGFRFPANLLDAIGRIHALQLGQIPAIVALESRPDDWPADPITIDSVRLDGFILDAFVSWGGGCREHSVDLVAWNGWLESNPVQLGLILAHDGRGDPCDAIVSNRRTFDLTPIRRAWEEAYGKGPGTILLNIPRQAAPALQLPFRF